MVVVAFLTDRVHCVDIDDLAKLKKLLYYLRATQHRGIVLRIGDNMTVSAYIDASYGIRLVASHTPAVILC